jgi:hypothetical protein
MRRTQNLTQALERLAPWVNDISVTEAEERGRWVITTPTDPWGLGPTSKRTKNAAAMLADLAMRQLDADQIRAEVNWVGRIPLSGLAAHEEAALLWLRREI